MEMKTKFLKLIKKYGITGLVALSTLLIMHPSHWYLPDLAQSFAPQFMLGFIGLGIVLYWWRKDKLAITLLLAGLSLFVFLRPYLHLGKQEKGGSEIDLKVAHFNIFTINTFYQETIDKALATQADLLSFQEVTAGWARHLENELCEKYPYYSIIPSDDSSFGIAIFSRHPLRNLKTIYWEAVPNIAGDIELPDSSIHFLASHTPSPITSQRYKTRAKHIQHIADYLKNFDKPVLAIGDYNVVPWNPSITALKKEANLTDSRIGITATNPSFLRAIGIPIDYIFHSPELKCVDFRAIRATGSDHLGIVGTYQIAKPISSI